MLYSMKLSFESEREIKVSVVWQYGELEILKPSCLGYLKTFYKWKIIHFTLANEPETR